MEQVQALDAGLQRIRGGYASFRGQTYNVFRVTSTTSESVLTTTPIITGFPLALRRSTLRDAIEDEFFALIVEVGQCNNSTLMLGDLLTETGYNSTGATWCFAQARPTRESLFVRCESTAIVTRTYTAAGRASQIPSFGAVSLPGYGGASFSTRQVLTIASGAYAFSAAGATPALVPFGLEPMMRGGSDHLPNDVPSQITSSSFLAFIPPLGIPGSTPLPLLEKDHLFISTDEEYEIEQVFTSRGTGLSGTIAKLLKVGF